MNSIQPVSLQPNTQPALNANEQRIIEASDTEYTLQSKPSSAQGIRGCVMVTTERIIWSAADVHVLHQPHGKLGVPLHCVSDLKQEGGGGLFWSDPHKISFNIKPMYENDGQAPEKFVLTFHHGGKADRDRVFSELARVLREKTWQLAVPAPVVSVPAVAPQAAVAPAKQPEADRRPDPDADGIYVKLPESEGEMLAGGAAAMWGPVPPARCGFDYDFALERKYAASTR